MSQHHVPLPGSAAIPVGPRSPSRPLDLVPLSREHSRLAWVPGSELVQESSRQGWLSANPQPRPSFLCGSDLFGDEGSGTVRELRLQFARKVLKQLYRLTVIITYHLTVTAATSESGLHRVFKRHPHVQAFFTHEE